ncbi:hypothetical protein DH2020_025005 [Rehmannia glutinosa]|uniref:RING-type domain-containing protein n=1 Tax=Rehmannia glutinosa TaxID=99300 RepID=A0ABR0W4Y7_REHGL
MSGSSRNNRPPSENWQSGHEYWIYLPTNYYSPSGTSLNPRGGTRDPWWLFEERSTRGPNYGLASFPSAAPARPSLPLFLIDDYVPTPMTQTPPTYYIPRYSPASAEEESRLSPEMQKQAVNKLRKQLYSPHINNIIKRLGTKSTGNSSVQDDDGKRCAVCLEDFESKQFVTLTPCNHMFHEDCIVPWVKSQGKCPVCRFIIF